MDLTQLKTEINAAWDKRDAVNADTEGAVRDAVVEALNLLDSGKARVAEPTGNHQWVVNRWLKKTVRQLSSCSPLERATSPCRSRTVAAAA